MTKGLFKEEYEFLEKLKEENKNDPVQWAYLDGKQAMLISWAVDVLTMEDVEEVLNS